MITKIVIVCLLVIIAVLASMVKGEVEAIHDPLVEVRQMTPERYRSEYINVGYIQSETGEYPLWGLRSLSRKNRWYYYTTSDPNNASSIVQLPLSYSGRDCMDEVGCDEIYEDENVTISGRAGEYKVHLYR